MRLFKNILRTNLKQTERKITSTWFIDFWSAYFRRRLSMNAKDRQMETIWKSHPLPWGKSFQTTKPLNVTKMTSVTHCGSTIRRTKKLLLSWNKVCVPEAVYLLIFRCHSPIRRLTPTLTHPDRISLAWMSSFNNKLQQ